MSMTRPGVVAHADWSVRAEKRWLCVAMREGGSYTIGAPEPVGDPATLPQRLMLRSSDRATLLGVDFPLGLPMAYAQQAGITSFLQFLAQAGKGKWSRVYDLCESADEIALTRPFYPRSPGGTRQAHLCRGLGVRDIDCLRRRAELRTDERGPAAPLFWTLGGQQVGRAAISGWRELLAERNPETGPVIKLWPFEGGLTQLLEPETLVVAETYPAESATQVGLTAPGRGWSKRRQSDRAAHAINLTRWAFSRRVTMSDALQPVLRDGFGDLANGEDQFDSVLGVCGMLEVVLGRRPEMPPLSNDRRVIEGWILGQRQNPAGG